MPLSAIAKKAGVGQGVLYRHFPTRARSGPGGVRGELLRPSSPGVRR
ncbi:TetR family transcriptional regulator [Paractinoplanes aksuensis]